MMLRAFIALEIPHFLRQAIAEQTAALRQALPRPLVRWVAPENIHLTLQFLGDVSPTHLDLLIRTLQAEAASHRPCELTIEQIGAFPTIRRPRVIWIGVTAPPALLSLQRGMQAAMSRLGYSPDEKKFSPHLTIGRVNQNASAAELRRIQASLEKTQVGTLGTFRAESISLFKSDLQPDGPIYTCLQRLPLQK